MTRKRARWSDWSRAGLCALIVVAPSLSCGAGGARGIDEARALVEGADEKMALATQAPGNQAEASEHAAAARADLRAARDLYFQAGADRSRDPELLSEFAALAVRTEDYDLAAKAYRRAAEFSPETNGYWLEAGRNFVRVGVGMADMARESLGVSLELAQRTGDEGLAALTNAQSGHLHRKLGLYELSRKYYIEALTTDPQLLSARLGLAGLNFRDGRVVEAAAMIEQIGMLQPADLMFLEAMLNFGYEGFRENRVWFTDTAANHLSYAKLLTRLQRLQDALAATQRAVELDDQSIVALNLLGSLARGVGDDARAREAFEQSLRVNPDQPRTTQALRDLESA